MRRKIFSVFGIVAIVAFFLPWLKACDKVESGFQLLIADSLKNFEMGSLSSFNTGLLFLLVPAYTVIIAWLVKSSLPPFEKGGSGGILSAPAWVRVAFGVLSILTFWNIGVWGGVEISALIEEWGTEQHVHSIMMAKLAAIQIIAAIALIVFLVKWLRKKRFNFGWSCVVLIFPLFAALGVGFTFEPRYYGMWLYLFAIAGLFVGSVWDALQNFANTCSSVGSPISSR